MNEIQEIADGIILIPLGVGAERIASPCAGVRKTRGYVVVGGGPRRQRIASCSKSELLAPAGLDQAIDRVVSVVAARLDPLISKIN